MWRTLVGMKVLKGMEGDTTASEGGGPSSGCSCAAASASASSRTASMRLHCPLVSQRWSFKGLEEKRDALRRELTGVN